MNGIVYFAFAAIFAAGCSLSSGTETNGKTAGANTVGDSVTTPANRQPVEQNKFSVNANKTVIQNAAISKENERNWERKNGGGKGSVPIVANAVRIVTAAPDNSEVTSRMNVNGLPLETRTFNNHPILAKIERLDLDDRNIKIYLRNGKSVKLPEGKITNFLSAPASDILNAAGLEEK